MDNFTRMYVHTGYRDRYIDRLDCHGTMAGGSAAEHILKFQSANGIDIA